MLPVELLLQSSADGDFSVLSTSYTQDYGTEVYPSYLSSWSQTLVPDTVPVPAGNENCTVPSHLPGEEGRGNEGFSCAMLVHSILTAMRRSVRKCSLAILNSKMASSRGMLLQTISAVPWHMYWGSVIQHGSKSCRAWAVAYLWSSMYLLGWLYAMLAQNQSLSALCKTALRVLSELYCLLTKTEDQVARYCWKIHMYNLNDRFTAAEMKCKGLRWASLQCSRLLWLMHRGEQGEAGVKRHLEEAGRSRCASASREGWAEPCCML